MVSQPDKPVGRKKIMTKTPVKVLAEENNIEILQPTRLKPHPNPPLIKGGDRTKEFYEIFGLYVQIGFTSSEGKWYYTNGLNDSKTLTVLNREKEAAGYKKDVWN